MEVYLVGHNWNGKIDLFFKNFMYFRNPVIVTLKKQTDEGNMLNYF